MGGHVAGSAEMLVARPVNLLGGLDELVDEIEPFALGDAEAIEHRQDHQRRQALGRRCHVVEAGMVEPGR